MPIERCLACGAEVPAGTGHCYRCLVALGMNPSDGGETDASAGDAVPACPSCGAPLPSDGVCRECASTQIRWFEDDLLIPGHLMLRVLGEGGMGRVYLAQDTTLMRRVAIKVMSDRLLGRPEAADRFLREARAMAQVDHPNVVRVHAFGTVQGRSYMVMEYVEGESLNRRLGKQGALSADTALRYLHQAVQALQAAWEHGLIHRDIKPSNILITSKEQVRVTDFGLAKAIGRPEEVSLTHSGHVVGTPLYMAPEQAQGAELDFRADLYSLGIVLFEMLAGHPPYRGDVVAHVIDQHLHAPFPSLRDARSEIPASMEQLCEWLARKDPANRPASHGELLGIIDELLSSGQAAESMPDLPSASSISGESVKSATPTSPIFVAREDELARLEGFMREALEGKGRVVFVTGEAGSGKTTLAAEFARQRLERQDDLVVAQGNCDARTGVGDPFLPFREILSLLTGEVTTRGAAAGLSRAALRRLWALFPAVAETIVDAGPDLVDTFVAGAPMLERAKERAPGVSAWRGRLAEVAKRNARLSPDLRPRQSELLDQYAQVLRRVSSIKPLLLVVEDLHWVDSGSAALLSHIADRLADSRILVVGTFRPDEIEIARGTDRHPMQEVLQALKRQFGDVEIPVGQQGGREFVEAYLDARPNRLDAAFREALFGRTRGHSLFTVELLRDLQDRGMLVKDEEGRWVAGASLDWDLLPARVEGVIEQRIGRLPEDQRRILKTASIEGEEFTAEAVAEVLGMPPRDVVRILGAELDRRHRLIRSGGVERVEGRRLSRYAFRHILFQKYLYGRLDEADRAYMHEEVGDALERLHGEQAGRIAERLAAHFEEAGLIERAIPYLRQAGERASRLSASTEAVALLHKALRLLEGLPEGLERDRQELGIQRLLISPLVVLKMFGSLEVRMAMERARDLCERIGDARQLFNAIHVLESNAGVRGALHEAHEMGNQLLRLAEDAGDPLLVGLAHWNVGFPLYYLGRHQESIEHVERMLAIYDPKEHQDLGYQFGFDPAVMCWAYWSWSQWYLGYPDRGLGGIHRMVEISESLTHQSSKLVASSAVNVFAILCGNEDMVREHLSKFMSLLPERTVTPWHDMLDVFSGWLRTREGDLQGGIDQMRRGRERWGNKIGFALFAFLIIEALRSAGRFEEALATLDEAFRRFETFEERLAHPYLHRLRGDLILETNGPEGEAEEAYRYSEDLARRSGTRSWLLRTAMSQARLLDRQGKRAEAVNKVRSVYDTFTEGFDTADLRAAKELLESLGS